MTNPIVHLSESQIDELVERYYAGEKISILLKDFNVKIQPSQLVRILPPEVLQAKCEYCDERIIKRRQSREQSTWNKVIPYCPACGHKPYDACDCINCKKRKKDLMEKEASIKRNFLESVENAWSSKKNDFEELDIFEKIYLGAFLREGISEDYNEIKPIDSFMIPLAPNALFVKEVVDALISKKAIILSSNTDPNYIEILNDEKGSYQYYTYKVKWRLNITRGEMSKVPLIESIVNPPVIDVESYNSLLSLWRKLALYEVLDYLEYSINNILETDYKIGEKTLGVISELLNSYSVSQIYGIIYSAVNSALRFQKERGVSKVHAANTVVGSAQSYGERAKIGKWDLKRFSRIKEIPQSALSKFFFERVVRIGRLGFDECPRIEIIERSKDLEN